MIDVSVTFDELLAIRKAIFVALAHVDIGPEIGVELLEAADARLAKAAPEAICKHCDQRVAKRRDGICERCNAYRVKYNRLPSEETLLRSARRESQRPRTGRPRNRRKPRDARPT